MESEYSVDDEIFTIQIPEIFQPRMDTLDKEQ